LQANLVSGTVSLPSRGAFHLSLTVLVHYRLVVVFSLGGWSPLLPTGLPLARGTHAPAQSQRTFAYGTLTPSGRPFQRRSADALVAHSARPPSLPPTGRPTPP